MASTANEPLKQAIGQYAEYPMKADSVVYEGSAVKLAAATGYAEALTAVASDIFVGHAAAQANNTDGSASDINVKVLTGKYRLQVSLTGAAVTGVGANVYASDDETYTVTGAAENVLVGKVTRYVSSGKAVVEFETPKVLVAGA